MNFAMEELKKLLKRTDGQLLLALSLWPVLFSIIIRISPSVMNYSGKLSGLGFLNQQLFVQSGILVPLILMIYMASLSFYQEMEEKQVYLYKDIPRIDILHGKYFSIFTMYFLFLLLFMASSILSYYLIFQGVDQASGSFLLDKEEWILLYDNFQIVLAFVFYIHIGLSLSLRLPTGASIFGALFLYLFIKTTPEIQWAKYLTPAGFREIIDFGGNNLLLTLALSLLVWLLYNIPLYLWNRHYYRHAEFN
ncbi:MAG: hypothetical protein Q4G11_02945 [Gallicola sp.]|nr:hypothetical protein [Gallicola sp.]